MNAADEQLDRLRGLVTIATQHLLGDTIAVEDPAWRGPSRLPEWSRGHVATHVARQADALCRLTTWARTGQRIEMYASPEVRNAEIEEGAGRPGLELQIDLDTSAGRLTEAWETLDHDGGWDTTVEMRGGVAVPARLLPLARLLELAIHHVDLDIGYEIDDIDEQTADWLLEWYAFRLRTQVDYPKLDLSSDAGFTISVGNAGEPIEVGGTSHNLLGWLLNRVDPSAIRGADGLKLPSF